MQKMYDERVEILWWMKEQEEINQPQKAGLSWGTRNYLEDMGRANTTDATEKLYEMALRWKKEVEEREQRRTKNLKEAEDKELEELKKMQWHGDKKTTIKNFESIYPEF